MKPAIRVDNLSKQYVIGRQKGGYRTLRESLADSLVAPFRRLGRFRGAAANRELSLDDSNFSALKDVSFEVQPGEVVGIIGRNGAGKSTLLKILSRITEPTSGRVELHGRVGSLLEVGTGFHPELTGRENVFLNGAVLGLRRSEIARKFDDIVAFAEIEQFLDTPVKRYSSGMYMRLAFAVAAHLEPEILLVDEVLAVGDAAFQRKCLGKLQNVAHAGRTVLFVSHNMTAVEGLCQRGVVLDQGKLAFQGDATAAVRFYHHSVACPAQAGHRFDLSASRAIGARPEFQVLEIKITSGGILTEAGYPIGAPLEFQIECLAMRPVRRLVVAFGIHRAGRGVIAGMHTQRAGACLPDPLEGRFTLTCSITDLLLPAGEYTISMGAKCGGTPIYNLESAGTLTILPTDFHGSGYNPDPGQACVLCRQVWDVKNSA